MRTTCHRLRPTSCAHACARAHMPCACTLSHPRACKTALITLNPKILTTGEQMQAEHLAGGGRGPARRGVGAQHQDGCCCGGGHHRHCIERKAPALSTHLQLGLRKPAVKAGRREALWDMLCKQQQLHTRTSRPSGCSPLTAVANNPPAMLPAAQPAAYLPCSRAWSLGLALILTCCRQNLLSLFDSWLPVLPDAPPGAPLLHELVRQGADALHENKNRFPERLPGPDLRAHQWPTQ